jgi:predicted signal transduction protein with EAL and GGDEF domain/PAS domain-containing protein
MALYHPLLLRQLERLGIEPDGEVLSQERFVPLLARVSRAYEDADKGQYLLRRAQDLSSKEMGDLYHQLSEAHRIAGLGNWSFDPTTGVGTWSEECSRLFGFDAAAPVPGLRPLLALMHESSRRPFLWALGEALYERRPFELELRLLPRGGNTRWISVLGQAVCGEDGKVRRLHGTVMAITRRKQTELRQAVEHTVAQLLAEIHSPTDAMPRILATICTALGWSCGAYWKREAPALDGTKGQGPDVFRRVAAWTAPRSNGEQFLEESAGAVCLAGGEGLVARTADLAEPLWIADVTHDPLFLPRRQQACAAGLRAAFAFPIQVQGSIAGVVEFLDRRVQLADEGLLDSARSLGRQIGQFLQRKAVEEHVHHLAFNDPLTNLPNRSMFNRQLGHALMQATRHNKRLAVLFIDLDRFKVINDTLGHDAGDRLLREMSRRLSACLRQGDTLSHLDRKESRALGEGTGREILARLGGDEFVVLIEDLQEVEQAAQVASKLLDALLVPYRLDDYPVHITASIGVAVFPEDGRDERTLMKHADIAMYRTKESGKNNFQFYSSQMDQHTHALLALESDLRFALHRREFRLCYQAKFDIATGQITGTEALVRWQHPTVGMMAPDQFIPIAEETGLVVPLGKWVLDQACAQNMEWQRHGVEPLRIAVNLSARQFANESLLGDIAASLRNSGMPPSLLELEITESTVMRNPDKVIFVLDRLKRMGVRVAIDDFGIGYSSLVQLKRLPIDIIKIDRSFIKDCPDDFADVAITRAVIGIGKSLNLQVVAEGVETSRHWHFVRDNGCNEMQGFLCSAPLSADDFVEFYRQNRREQRSATRWFLNADGRHDPVHG